MVFNELQTHNWIITQWKENDRKVNRLHWRSNERECTFHFKKKWTLKLSNAVYKSNKNPKYNRNGEKQTDEGKKKRIEKLLLAFNGNGLHLISSIPIEWIVYITLKTSIMAVSFFSTLSVKMFCEVCPNSAEATCKQHLAWVDKSPGDKFRQSIQTLQYYRFLLIYAVIPIIFLWFVFWCRLVRLVFVIMQFLFFSWCFCCILCLNSLNYILSMPLIFAM